MKKFHRGFTIVELLVVIVVIGILATLVIVAYNGVQSRAQEATRKSDEAQARKQIEAFFAVNSAYPVSNTCPTTATNQICLKASPSNTISYSVNNAVSPPTYSLSVNATPTTPSIVTNGLVLHLDAGNTSSYPGTGTVWTDLSGSGNNGTLINGPTYNSSNAGSIVFDGTDDYVSLQSGALLPTGTSDRTVFACVRTPTSFPAYIQHIIHWGTANTNQAYGLVVYNSGAVGSHPWGTYPSQGTVSVNTDYCLTSTYTNSSALHKFFINGVSTGAGVTQAINTISSDARIGSRIANFEWWGPGGRVYNILVYNKSLSDSEVTQNFNAHRNRFGI